MKKIIVLILLASVSLFSLEIKMVKTKNWRHGFCAKVMIHNSSDTLKKWTISFDAQGEINTLWNANYEQNSTSLITRVSGLHWNSIIPSKESVSFGYCANKPVAKEEFIYF